MECLENLSPAPRHVPLVTKLRVIMGGSLQQFGWIAFSIGMLFVYAFIVAGGVFEAVQKDIIFRRGHQTVQGKFLSADETIAEGVVRLNFSFKVEGHSFASYSYLQGSDYQEGQEVVVEYSTEDPSLARIQGSRWSTQPVSIWFFVVPFPGLGVLLIGLSLFGNLRTAKLLSHGELAQATLVSTQAISMDKIPELRGKTFSVLTLKFTAKSTGREHKAVTSSRALENLENGKRLPLLYLPSRPEQTILFADIPGHLELDAEGRFKSGNPLSAVPYLIFPGLGFFALAVTLQAIWKIFS